MSQRTSFFRKIALFCSGLAISCALFITSGFTNVVSAQAITASPVLPCSFLGAGTGVINECHIYDYVKDQSNEVLKSFQFAVVQGLLNAIQFFTQQIAIDTANWMLNGFQGKGSAFYNQTFGSYLGSVALSSANQFLSSVNTFTSSDFGFNLCAPISLNLKLSLGIGKIATLPAPNCTFQTIATNFESTYRSLEPENLANTLKQTIQPGGNDLSVNISTSQKFLNTLVESHESNILQRQEGGGLKSVTDFVSGRITTPAQVVKDTVGNTNLVGMTIQQKRDYTNAMALGAFQLGLKQIPVVAASTFINTLAVGLLQKFFSALNSSSDTLANANLTNPDAQTSGGPTPLPVAITDIVTPNLITADKQDFLYELSTCNTTERGTWGCSLDDGFVNALRSVTDSGGYTIARAAGIGAQPPSGGNIFLHSDWELIPESDSANNQDPNCYTRAYCSSNLAKLRFARIISIGWELAANSPFNTKVNGKYATLGQVVQGFNNCLEDTSGNLIGGGIDAQHPWCHLINPAWVLTEPQFQCNLRGYGDTVLSGSVQPMRIQECEDVVSCLQRDDHGNCVGGYGYCLSERPVWRFGADACDAKYVSCRTYVSRDKSTSLTGVNVNDTATGPQVSYLRNTIDYGSCSAENIGCQYYYDLRDTSTTATDQWVTDVPASTKLYNANSVYTGKQYDPPTYSLPSIKSPRVYFDATVQTCDASQDGCTKVYDVTAGQSAFNFVQNGSFEQMDKNDPTKLVGWQDGADIKYKLGAPVVTNHYNFTNFQPQTGSASVDGAQSFSIGAHSDIRDTALVQRVKIEPLRNYVLSYYVRNGSGGSVPESVILAYLLNKDGQKVSTPANFYRDANCGSQIVGDGQTSSTRIALDQGGSVGTDWARRICSFVSNSDAQYADIVVVGENVAIDAIQLEESNAPTDFVDGVNPSLPVDYLKIPPTELACTGNQKQDRQECGNYARVCQQSDAGCQGYTDAGGSDPTEIPATLNTNDLCPATCVGYAEYRKQASAFDLVHDANSNLDDPQDNTSAYFIPSAAGQCSAAAAGCEQFTNIESAAQGGEQSLYLTYARACEKPNDQTRTYFTWEGSDTTGYQLKTWSLIGSAGNSAPKIIQKAGPDGVLKDPTTCTEASWKTGVDPDCRQFYDAQGDVFYLYYSQTVESSPDCRDYRKDNSDQADCTKTSGDAANFNPTTKECVYHILATESNECSAVDVGCRAYIGTTGRNSVSAYSEDFASASGTLFTVPQGSVGSVGYSSEALLVGDYSLKVQPGNAGVASTLTTFPSATNTLYSVSFWAKTTDSHQQTATLKVNGAVVGTFTMQVDWTRYEIGPFRVTNTKASSTLEFWNLPNVTYLDTVNVERLQDVVYAKQNSWTVPAECDQTVSGIPQPQAMLGCREYTDRKGATVDVRQFSHLCRYDSVGCAAFVNTHNSNSPYQQTFTEQGATATARPWDQLFAGTVTTTRPGFGYIYLIDEPSAHCDASNMSCRSFGKPIFDSSAHVTSTQTVYLIDDVTQYADDSGAPKMLCRPSELFCDRFVSGSITSYFRDPNLHSCTWQDKVGLPALNGTFNGKAYNIPAGQYSGWFVDGANPPQPCNPTELAGGNTFLDVYSGAADYNGWTSTCPQEQSECTEFRDPNDHTDQAHPLGRSYYFIANSHLDETSCNGSVSPFDGCVLFRDMNDSVLNYSVLATYAKSHADGDTPESPIDCSTDPTNPYCKKAGTCTNVQKAFEGGKCNDVTDPGSCEEAAKQVARLTNAACTTDDDCYAENDYSIGNNYPYYSFEVQGTCQQDDANRVIKVKLDRDCSTWLGCSTGETVYDPSQGQYTDLCTNLAVCDQLGASGSNFCGHYLDRSAAGKPDPNVGFFEPVLREGVFMDAVTYAKRPVQFGSPDYSSYALPNHFQIADIITRPVGYELLAKVGSQKFDYYHDYRSVASVPFCSTPGVPAGDVSCATVFQDPAHTELNLCQFQQTKQVGYFVPNEKPQRCYLSIDTPYAQNNADYLEQGTGSLNPRNAQTGATKFEQLPQPMLDQSLSEAYPPAECKAYPDSQSPFPNQYVTTWDFTKDPPEPSAFAPGYDGATYCEYGQNCSCSYRKVDYGGASKYYSLYGGQAPEGVCQGGPHDGEGCVPNQGQTQDVPSASSATSTPTGSNAPTSFCGSGTCQAVQNVSFVRGVYGQCLERDLGRTVAGSQSYNPCLVWSPEPVLFGQNDVYHYQPTSGYLPPQNAGEYYCASNALPPRDLSVPAFVPNVQDDGSLGDPSAKDQWITPPGQTGIATDHYVPQGNGFNYDEVFVADGDCIGCAGSDATFLDGNEAKGGDMGSQCQSAKGPEKICPSAPSGYECQSIKGSPFHHMGSWTSGRWISTGRGNTQNYAEYFIPLSATNWAEWLLNRSSDPGQSAVADTMLEQNFSYFKFSPIPDPGQGMIGCGYSQDWVDGVTVSDYSDSGQVKQGTTSWLSAFNANFAGSLTPNTADFLRASDGTLQKVPCYYSPDNIGKSNASYDDNDQDQTCYVKFWQVGYRDAGQPEFQLQSSTLGGPNAWVDQGGHGILGFASAQGSKSYFAIRAVFEDANPLDNAQTPDKEDPSGNALQGPYRFIGFWITAATPGINTERAIYMTLDIGHADICKQVAQVVAPDTRDSVPFMDRIWASSGFNLPLLGVTYSSVNQPFGSAKNTKPIGKDPLFQMAGTQPGTQSVLRPSTWVSSGATYFSGTQDPVSNWGWLTNLFAKVYRIYNYFDRPVGKSSWACVAGPRAGSWCPDLSGDQTNPPYGYDSNGVKVGQTYCGLTGICDSTQVDPTQGQGLCNAFSGVNRGLTCNGNIGDPIGGYHVCHAAPVKMVSGSLTPQYTTCDVQTGWTQTGPDSYMSQDYNNQFYGGSKHSMNGVLASHRGGLRCHGDAVKNPDGLPALCTKATGLSASSECPVEIDPDSAHPTTNEAAGLSWCKKDANGEGHCTNGYETASCTRDEDCRFTWMEWWNGGKDMPKPYDFVDQYLWQSKSVSVGDPGKASGDWDVSMGNSGLVSELEAIDPDFGVLCDPNYQGGNGYKPYTAKVIVGGVPLPIDSCLLAYSHGGRMGITQQTSDIHLGYIAAGMGAYTYSPAIGSDSVGTPDFPYLGVPYNRGQMMNQSDVLGNLWWDGVKTGAGGMPIGPSTDDPSNGSPELDIGKKNLTGGRYTEDHLLSSSGNYGADQFAFPGAYMAGENIQGNWNDGNANHADIFIPGHCERPPVTPPADFDNAAGKIYTQAPANKLQPPWGYYDVPYYSQTYEGPSYPGFTQRYFKGSGSDWTPGVCTFGELEGKTCNNNSDCAKPGYDKSEQAASYLFCQPVSKPDGKTPSSGSLSLNGYSFKWDCSLPLGEVGDANSTDLDLDDNVCTHSAGYYPESSICGNDPLRQECLTGMSHDDATSYNPKKSPLPTDVTAGLYTPLYLGKDPATYNGNYSYVSYYTPRPPTIAAPDTSRACPAAGQCPIALVNTFSLENQAEGRVSYVGGQAVATIRFYGWAADNQAPLTDVWVDWGDGNIQQVHDAKMKNKKPFCGGTKQCQFVPGLTCSTDADCPPASGKCVDVGFCNAHPNVSCEKDADCNSGALIPGATADTCNIRPTFGSATDDCEQNYFQYEHAYSCGTKDEASKMPVCAASYCSHDNTRACTSNANCAPGDTCNAGLAPPGGCYDASTNACRFTPRVELKDAWGWCTGECRIQDLGGGKLGSAVGQPFDFSENHVLFANGGCYDASGVYQNDQPTKPYSVATGVSGEISNTCDPQATAGTNYRPWMVYNGALQLGVAP
jgi:hypothetical protein